MMQRNARNTLSALLIAFHATIALCGPGLHAAPYMGHDSPSGTVRKPDGQLELTKLAATATEHCPLCDFFAQGQLPLPPSLQVSARVVLPFEPADLPLFAPRPPHLSSRSRAPPLGDARIV
jgi:hypothetical protein